MKRNKRDRDAFRGTWGKETILEICTGIRLMLSNRLVHVSERNRNDTLAFRATNAQAVKDELGMIVDCYEVCELIEGAPVKEDGEPEWEWREDHLVHRWFEVIDQIGEKAARDLVGEIPFDWLEERRREIGTGCHRFELDVAPRKPGVEKPCRGCGEQSCYQIHYACDDRLLGDFCSDCSDEILGDTADPQPRFWAEGSK